MTDPLLHAQVLQDQGYHAPRHPEIADHLGRIRHLGIEFSEAGMAMAPDNRHLRRALELIDEAQMYLIKACVIDQDRLAAMLGVELPS